MAKFTNTQQINNKTSPHSAGHKRSRPLSSISRLPSLSVLVISDSNDSSSSSSKGRFCLAPVRKSEMRKGWGSFKSRQRYSSLTSLDSSSTVSTSSTSSQLSMCSTPSTPSTPVLSSVSDEVEFDSWGFFADF